MKANEIPEKIYVQPDAHDGWFEYNNPNKTLIEYTRTDAFIEKVENFLEMLGYGFTITDNITHADYDKEQLIEDFKNYIKGE